jgi:hypothetical protein
MRLRREICLRAGVIVSPQRDKVTKSLLRMKGEKLDESSIFANSAGCWNYVLFSSRRFYESSIVSTRFTKVGDGGRGMQPPKVPPS